LRVRASLLVAHIRNGGLDRDVGRHRGDGPRGPLSARIVVRRRDDRAVTARGPLRSPPIRRRLTAAVEGSSDMTEQHAGIALPGSVLVVCTANVCRSPLAEVLLSEALPDTRVSSAGVRALTDASMCPVSASMLRSGTRNQHTARQLTVELVAAADLVLVMERAQRSAVVRLAPGSQAKVFTLREAVALAEDSVRRGAPAPQDVARLARSMHASRGVAPLPVDEVPKRRRWSRPVAPGDPLTIVDGHGLTDAEHRVAVEQVAAVTMQLLEAFRGAGSPVPGPTAS
jgi:protein-tyrosine phosphatase